MQSSVSMYACQFVDENSLVPTAITRDSSFLSVEKP